MDENGADMVSSEWSGMNNWNSMVGNNWNSMVGNNGTGVNWGVMNGSNRGTIVVSGSVGAWNNSSGVHWSWGSIDNRLVDNSLEDLGTWSPVRIARSV